MKIKKNSGLIILLLIIIIIYSLFIAGAQSPDINTKIKICILPVYTEDESLKEIAEKINIDLINNLKKLLKYEMPEQKEFIIFLADNNIQNSKDYNIKLREKIFNKYQSNFIITGKTYIENEKSFLKINIISITNGRLISSIVKENPGADTEAVLHSINEFIQNRYNILKNHIPKEYVFTKDNYGYNEFDLIKRTEKICFIPFASKNESMQIMTDKYNNELKENIFLNNEEYHSSEKILTLYKIKDYKDYNNEIRKKIYSMHKIDFIVTGILNNKDNAVEIKLKIIEARYGVILLNISLWTNTENINTEYNIKSMKLRLMNADNFNMDKINTLVKIWDKETEDKIVSDEFEYSKSDDKGQVLVVKNTDNSTYPYYLHLPPDYDKNNYSYPVLIYLHGGGGYQDYISPIILLSSPFRVIYGYKDGAPVIDKEKLKNLNKYLKSSFCIIPQLSGAERKWSPEKLLNILIEVAKKYPVNIKRIYVTGESQGGIGAWTFCSSMYNRIAAFAPVCAYGFGAENLIDMPVWTFHNFDDKIIEPSRSIIPALEILIPGDVKIMKNYPHQNNDILLPAPYDCTISYFYNKLGSWEKGVVFPKGKITFTLYKSGGHDAWTLTYKNDELWVWMFDQKR